MLPFMEVFAVLIAIFGTGFLAGYGVRALVSHHRRAQYLSERELG